MPITSPSYFPPASGSDQVRGQNAGKLSTGFPLFLAGKSAGQNSTVNGLVIIGDSSGAGGITDVNLAQSVIVGDGNLSAMTAAAGVGFPVTAIGSKIGPIMTHVDSSVFVGQSIANLYQGPDNADCIIESVFVGTKILSTSTGTSGFTQGCVL